MHAKLTLHYSYFFPVSHYTSNTELLITPYPKGAKSAKTMQVWVELDAPCAIAEQYNDPL